MAEIIIDVSGLTNALDRLVPELDLALEGAMALCMDIVAQEAAIRAPLVTGELIMSINAIPVTGTFSGGDLTGMVSAAAPHALAIEEGTKPRTIYPRKKKALRWADNGGKDGWRFAKKVNRPAVAAKPYLKPALAAKRDVIVSKFEVAVRLAIRRVELS